MRRKRGSSTSEPNLFAGLEGRAGSGDDPVAGGGFGRGAVSTMEVPWSSALGCGSVAASGKGSRTRLTTRMGAKSQAGREYSKGGCRRSGAGCSLRVSGAGRSRGGLRGLPGVKLRSVCSKGGRASAAGSGKRSGGSGSGFWGCARGIDLSAVRGARRSRGGFEIAAGAGTGSKAGRAPAVVAAARSCAGLGTRSIGWGRDSGGGSAITGSAALESPLFWRARTSASVFSKAGPPRSGSSLNS